MNCIVFIQIILGKIAKFVFENEFVVKELNVIIVHYENKNVKSQNKSIS